MLRIVAELLLVFCVLSGAIAFLSYASDIKEYSLEKSLRIHRDFIRISESILACQKVTSLSPEECLPEHLDLEVIRSPLKISVVTSPFNEEIVKELGAPPNGAFVLHHWRGEWSEYYGSWNGKSTVGELTLSDYYLGGTKQTETIIWSLISLGCFGGGLYLRRLHRGRT